MAGLIPWLEERARMKSALENLRRLAELEGLQQPGGGGGERVSYDQSGLGVHLPTLAPGAVTGQREAAYLQLGASPVQAQQALGQQLQNRAFTQSVDAFGRDPVAGPYALGALGTGHAPDAPYALNQTGYYDRYGGGYQPTDSEQALAAQRMAGAGADLALADQRQRREPMPVRVNGETVYAVEVAPGRYRQVVDEGGAPVGVPPKEYAPRADYTQQEHPENRRAKVEDSCFKSVAEFTDPSSPDFYDQVSACMQKRLPVERPAGVGGALAGGDAGADPGPEGSAGMSLEALQAWMAEQRAAGIPEDLVQQVLREMGLALP